MLLVQALWWMATEKKYFFMSWVVDSTIELKVVVVVVVKSIVVVKLIVVSPIVVVGSMVSMAKVGSTVVLRPGGRSQKRLVWVYKVE